MAEQDPIYSDEFQAWLAGLGPNPYDLTEQDVYGYYGNTYGPPEDLDELGTLGYQNKVLTAGNKALGMGADPAFMYNMGKGPGGFSQDQFGYDSEYIPVQAPGFSALNYHSQGDDPLMNYVSEQFAAGAGALAIENKLRDTISKGGNEGAAVEAMIPTADDQDGNPYKDWKRLGTILDALQKDIINDPQFNSFDPETGLPAYEKKTAKPGQEFIDRTGKPSPYEQYSPDLLARSGSLEREAGTRDEYGQLNERANADSNAAQEQLAMMRASLASGGTGTFDVPRPEGYAMPQGPASLGDRPSAEGGDTRNWNDAGAVEAWWKAQDALDVVDDFGGAINPFTKLGGIADSAKDFITGDPVVAGFLQKPDQGEAKAAAPVPAIEAQGLQDFSTADRIARIQALNGSARGNQPPSYEQRGAPSLSPLADEQRSYRNAQAERSRLKGAENESILAREKVRRQRNDDEYAALERGRMMNYLSTQGYTPFDQAQRASQGAIWGR